MNESQTVKLTPEMLEQNPALALAISAMSLLIMFLLIGSLASWIYLILRMRRGRSLLVVERCAPRVWGLADLMVVAVLIVACQIFFASLYARLAGVQVDAVGSGQTSAAIAAAGSFGSVIAIVFALGWLALRFQVSPEHVGFRQSGWWRQLQMGVIATLAVLPFVYLLMAAVSIGLQSDYKHPLLDEVRRNATLSSYLLGVLTAVLMGPLAEEFLFRVMIQGWLQSWAVSTPRQILLGASLAERKGTSQVTRDRLQSQMDNPNQPADWNRETKTVVDRNESPRFSISSTPESDTDIDPSAIESPLEDAKWVFTPPLWPAIVTGTLFGLAHWGYGLSFIPLIVLGIVLGLLYRATHSIWPCLLVHFALNGSSMLGLGLSILVERIQ